MAQFPVIRDGVVSNVVEASEERAAAKGLVAFSAGVSIGWLYDDGTGKFSPPFVSLDDLKAAKRAAVTALLDSKLTGGYRHDFGEPHGFKVLQTRNIEDRTNWLTSQASYSAAVAAGAGAVMGAAFRTEDNVNLTLSYADGLAVLLAMAAWGAAHYARSWELKDLIDAAEDEAALVAIDIEAGWPG